MLRTFHTSVTGHDLRLDAMGTLFGHATRQLHTAMRAGRMWSGDLQTSLYQQLGLTSAHLAHVHVNLTGMHASAQALTDVHRKSLERRLRAKQKQIGDKERKFDKNCKALAKARYKSHKAEDRSKTAKTALAAKPSEKKYLALDKAKATLGKVRAEIIELMDKQSKLRTALHQHKRKAASLQHDIDALQASESIPSIAFGSRRLFKQQHSLHTAGHHTHERWREAWRAERMGMYFAEGVAFCPQGRAWRAFRMARMAYAMLEVLLERHRLPFLRR